MKKNQLTDWKEGTGLSYKQIAQLMGLTYHAVYMHFLKEQGAKHGRRPRPDIAKRYEKVSKGKVKASYLTFDM